MKVNFNSNTGKGKDDHAKMTEGNFEDMMKMRKKQLPKIEATIQEALKDYDGGNITIVITKEDENGLPIGHSLVMAGVGRMECQVDMAFALDKASDAAMEALLEQANGNAAAMLQVAAMVVKRKMQESN